MTIGSDTVAGELRKIAKLPINTICPNCGTYSKAGFDYVCLPFMTFICSMCMKAHKSIGHETKLLDFNKSSWTVAEVEKIKKEGGNDRALKSYLALAPKRDNEIRPVGGLSFFDVYRSFIFNAYEDEIYYSYKEAPTGCLEVTSSGTVDINNERSNNQILLVDIDSGETAEEQNEEIINASIGLGTHVTNQPNDTAPADLLSFVDSNATSNQSCTKSQSGVTKGSTPIDDLATLFCEVPSDFVDRQNANSNNSAPTTTDDVFASVPPPTLEQKPFGGNNENKFAVDKNICFDPYEKTKKNEENNISMISWNTAPITSKSQVSLMNSATYQGANISGMMTTSSIEPQKKSDPFANLF